MDVAKTAVSIASAKDAELSLLKAHRIAEELVRKYFSLAFEPNALSLDLAKLVEKPKEELQNSS